VPASNNSFIELSQFILDMGYDEKTAEMVISFLKTQDLKVRRPREMKSVLITLNTFVEKNLKPRYIDSSLNRLLALIDISIQYEAETIYFIKQLFNPDYEDGRMLIFYAYMRYVTVDRYELAYLEPNGDYCIVHKELRVNDCLKVLETDPLFEP
jgi:hypothetical protein